MVAHELFIKMQELFCLQLFPEFLVLDELDLILDQCPNLKVKLIPFASGLCFFLDFLPQVNNFLILMVQLANRANPSSRDVPFQRSRNTHQL